VAAVFVGEVAEGTGDRLVDHHLAQLAHDEEGDQAGDAITQQHGRPCHLDRLRDAEEKAGADRAAQRDQLDMPAFQAALQFSHLIPSCVMRKIDSRTTQSSWAGRGTNL
jgi:hypothetical protein